MTRFRGLICVFTIAALVAAVGASAATATTFYVNKRNGNDAAPCTHQGGFKLSELPCATIVGAIKRAEEVPGPNTIDLNAEENPFENEAIDLNSAADKGLTINGEEAGVEIVGKTGTTIVVGASAGAITLSNIRVVNRTGAGAAIGDTGAELTLDNMVIENESGGGVNGVEVKKFGSLTINGGSVTMENGASGFGVFAEESPVSMNGVSVIAGGASEAEAGGVYSLRSGLTIANSKVGIESGKKESTYAIRAKEDGSVQLQNDSVRQEGLAFGIVGESSTVTANGLSVKMGDAASKKEAVGLSSVGSSSFDHLEVGGTWAGPVLLSLGANVTVADSRLITNAAHEAPALIYAGGSEGSGLLVQRSVLQAAPNAKPGTLQLFGGSATVDSSEILGGLTGVAFVSLEGTRTLTLAASTVDAGAPGVSADASGVTGVEAEAQGTKASVANVAIEGSIVLEQQTTSTEPGDQVSVSCTYSAAPSQILASKSGSGSIACASGSNGNTNVTAELPSLFAEPFTSYALSPSSSAVDSVPAGAIVLPAGITPSATDLAGNPRVVDGNGDCIAAQDKGALELQGHSAACPIPSVPSPGPPLVKPIAGVISVLTISPSAFFAAAKGATILPLTSHTKKLGAKISWRDSQAATTTFTVLRPIAGRKQGKSCKVPSKINTHAKHSKPCTLYLRLGTFTHVDVAGANSLRFSGRLHGKRLPAGTYRLQAVARNAAGNGVAVFKSFKIK